MTKKIPWRPPMNQTVRQEKRVINKKDSKHLDAVVVYVERVDNLPHYIIRAGAGAELRFVGRDEWYDFLVFLEMIDWTPTDTLIRKKPKKRTFSD